MNQKNILYHHWYAGSKGINQGVKLWGRQIINTILDIL
jgi:hypothetical protein